MAILNKNPNLGIEYRVFVDGQIIRSGSYFGKNAADFLNGLNMAVGAGLLSPVVGTAAYIGVMSDSLGGAHNTSQKVICRGQIPEKAGRAILEAADEAKIDPTLT